MNVGTATAVEVQANAFAPSGTRTTFSVSYAIKNTSTEIQTLAPSLNLPEGWRVLLPPVEVTLAAGQETSGIAIVAPPLRAKAGPYPATLKVAETVIHLTLDMPAQPSVTAQLVDAPTFVVGTPYVATFRVINTGNTLQNLRFSAFTTQNFEVVLDRSATLLTPGQQVDVQVRVDVPTRFARAVKNLVVFQVRGDSELTSSSSTEALPGALPPSETHITLPLTVRTGVEVSGGQGAFAAGVAGGTTLADGSSVAFDLNTRTPVAEYRRGPVRVEVGYDASPGGGNQTAEGGALAGSSTSSTSTSTGLSRQSTPGVVPALGVPGFRVSYDTRQVGVETRVLLTGPGGSSLPISQVSSGRLGFTVGARALPLPSLSLSGYGVMVEGRREWDAKLYWTTFSQEADRIGQRPAQAGEVSAEVKGSADRFEGRITGSVSTPHHYGLAQYSVLHDGISSAQEIFGSYTFSQNVYALNINAAYGTQRLGAEPGLVLRGAVSRSFQAFSVALGHTYRSVPFLSEVRNETRFSVLSTLPFFSQHLLTWRTDPGNTLSYEGSATILTRVGTFEPSLNLTRDFQKDTLRIGGTLDYAKAINRQVSVGVSVKKEDFSKEPWTVEASGRYLLRNGSVITAKGSVRFGGVQNGSSHVGVGYELPLDIPLSPRTDIGRLSGTLVDEAGQPLSGLLMRLGPLQATTDTKGHYVFPAVPEGIYYLNADAGQLGAARVTTPSLPERLEIRRTDNVARSYMVVRAARVGGRVTVAQAMNALTDSSVTTPVQDSAALTAGLLLELRSDTGTLYRTLTDAGGNFSFEGLLPGAWSLSIAPGVSGKDSPRYNGFTVSVVGGVFQLKSGDEGQAEIRVTPVARELKITNGGTLDVSPTPLPSAPGTQLTPPAPTPESPRQP